MLKSDENPPQGTTAFCAVLVESAGTTGLGLGVSKWKPRKIKSNNADACSRTTTQKYGKLTTKPIPLRPPFLIVLVNLDFNADVQPARKGASADPAGNNMLGPRTVLAGMEGGMAIFTRMPRRSDRFVARAVSVGGASFAIKVEIGFGLGYNCVIPAGHGAVVEMGSLGTVARIAVEEIHQRLMCAVVESMDFIAACEQVRDGFGRWLVRDGGADQVGDVAMVFGGGDGKLRIAVKASHGCEVNVAA